MGGGEECKVGVNVSNLECGSYLQKKKAISKDSAIIVLAWNFFDEIKKNNPAISSQLINIKDLGKI